MNAYFKEPPTKRLVALAAAVVYGAVWNIQV
jgi:hypothetical protein